MSVIILSVIILIVIIISVIMPSVIMRNVAAPLQTGSWPKDLAPQRHLVKFDEPEGTDDVHGGRVKLKAHAAPNVIKLYTVVIYKFL